MSEPILKMLLLGDPGVGKSSLILSLLTETFIPSDKIPKKCEPITIPKDVTPEQIETLIIDWSDLDGSVEKYFQERQKNRLLQQSSMSSSKNINRIFLKNYLKQQYKSRLEDESGIHSNMSQADQQSNLNPNSNLPSTSILEDLQNNILIANVILLVYDTSKSQEEILSSIEKWMTLIRNVYFLENSENSPFLLHSNKSKNSSGLSAFNYSSESDKNSNNDFDGNNQSESNSAAKFPPIILVGNKIDLEESMKEEEFEMVDGENDDRSNQTPSLPADDIPPVGNDERLKVPINLNGSYSQHSMSQAYDLDELENQDTLPSNNKLSQNNPKTLQEKIFHLSKKLLSTYHEIEICIETSAKSVSNISELFYQAQKSVLYPLIPLYKLSTKSLTPRAVKAIDRVFYLSDLDSDQHLDENELSELQRKAFNAPLPGQALDDLRNLVKNYDQHSYFEWKDKEDMFLANKNENSEFYLQSGSENGDSNQLEESKNKKFLIGVTNKGFKILMKALIERGRQDTVWILLRTFGYDNNLNIGREIGPFFLPNELKILEDDITELSDHARYFLAVLFDKFDLDKDGVLNGQEQKQLFKTLPIPPYHRTQLNWQVECDKNSMSNITLTGFLSWYDYKAFFSPRSVLCDLAYFGYPILSEHSLESGIEIKRRRQPSQKVFHKKSKYRTPYGTPLVSRRVFLVKILGARYSGKSTLMQGLIKHDLKTCLTKFSCKKEPGIVAAEIGLNGQEYVNEEDDYFVTLIMNELPFDHIEENNYNQNLIKDADVIGLVYNPNEESSYHQTMKIYSQLVHTSGIPSMLISSVRGDEFSFDSDGFSVVKPEQIEEDLLKLNKNSRKHGTLLYGPVEFDPRNILESNFFSTVAKMAVDPQLLMSGNGLWQPIAPGDPENKNNSKRGLNSKKLRNSRKKYVQKNENKTQKVPKTHNSKGRISLAESTLDLREETNQTIALKKSFSFEKLTTAAVVVGVAGILTGLVLTKKL